MRKQPVLIHIPKTAGTAIREALQIEKKGHTPFRERRDVHREDSLVFAVIREPFSRAVSMWKYFAEIYDRRTARGFRGVGLNLSMGMLARGLTCSAFWELWSPWRLHKHSNMFHTQAWYLKNRKGEVDPGILLLRHETLAEEGWPLLLEGLDRLPRPLPVVNKTKARPPSDTRLSTKAQGVILDFFKEDFEQLGYPARCPEKFKGEEP